MDSVAIKHQQTEDALEPTSEYPTTTLYQIKVLVERLVMKTLKEPKTSIAGLLRYSYRLELVF